MIPPSEEERRWLLQLLAERCMRCGADRLTRAPLVEDTPELFPEPWDGSPGAVYLFARRWMAHAGLEHLEVEIEPAGERAPATPFWLIDVDTQCARFALGDLPSRTVAMDFLCQEVARAYYLHHDLAPKPEAPYRGTARSSVIGPDEEILVTMTAVYLGFVARVAEATRRSRNAINAHYEPLPTVETGLSREHTVYLLALTAVIRDLDHQATTRLGMYAVRDLGPYWQQGFEDLIEELRPKRASLLEYLHLPEDVVVVNESPRLLPLEDERAAEVNERFAEEGLHNEGWPICRLRERRYVLYVAIAAPAAVVLGKLLQAASGLFELGAFAALGTLAVAASWAHTNPSYRCADRQCGIRLEPSAERCPGCGGVIAETATTDAEARLRQLQWKDEGSDGDAGTGPREQGRKRFRGGPPNGPTG